MNSLDEKDKNVKVLYSHLQYQGSPRPGGEPLCLTQGGMKCNINGGPVNFEEYGTLVFWSLQWCNYRC